MITLKYKKISPAIYISHIDLLRGMVRIIRRTGFRPEFSQGFNPHMLLFFSPPLALGVSSECEYVTIDIKDVSPEGLLDAFNKAAPGGIVGTAAYYTEKSPNLAGQIVAADYLFPTKDTACTVKIKEYLDNSAVYDIQFTQKKVLVTKDVRPLIKGVETVSDGLIVRLATGNDNLRADRLLDALKKDFGLDTETVNIIKIRQFVADGEKFTEVDKLLSENK